MLTNKILFVGNIEEVINYISSVYHPSFSNSRINIPYRYNTDLSFFIYDVNTNEINGEYLKLVEQQLAYSSIKYYSIDIDTDVMSKYSFGHIKKQEVFDDFIMNLKDIDLIIISRREKYGFRDTVSRICGETAASFLLGNYISKTAHAPVRLLATDYNRRFSLINLNHPFEETNVTLAKDVKTGYDQLDNLTNYLPLFFGFIHNGAFKAFSSLDDFKNDMVSIIDNFLDNDLKLNMETINDALNTKFDTSSFAISTYREQYCDAWEALRIFYEGEELANKTLQLGIKQINDIAEFNEIYKRTSLPELRAIIDDYDIDKEVRDEAIKLILSHEIEKFIKGKNSLKALGQFLDISRNSITISSNDEVTEYLKEKFSESFSTKIINKNKNNKNIPSLINNVLDPIFGKIIDWSELDEVLKRTLFPDKFETKSKYSELILRDLDPNLSKNYDLYSPISVLMLINLLSPEELENELSVLAPAMHKWISNKYTSTYNYDWTAYQICKSYILNGENKIINESNWKRLLIEIFKLISKDNTEREIKKFICFCIQGNIDFLSLIENEDVVKSNLKFKKVNMERKFN